MLQSRLVLASLAVLLAPDWSHAQESKAVFDAPLVVVPGDNRVEHLVDFDGDGWMDLLSWWYTTTGLSAVRVRGLRNDAGTGFSQAWEVTFSGVAPSGANAKLAVGDIDGDGDLDFAAEFRRKIQIYERDGLSQPTLHQTLTTADVVDDLALADFDGDGFADLIVRQADDKLLVHRNGGRSASWMQSLASTTDLAPAVSAMRVGELTGDGLQDLLFVLGQQVQILPLVSDGTLGAPIQFATASTWIMPRPAIGDLDGDGDDDVVVWDGVVPNGYYEILRRTAPGSFVLEALRSGGPATELADIDLDGDLDGICCGGGPSSTWLNSLASVFHVCHNEGGGVFTPSFQMRGIGSTHIAGANDIDHDGDVDLIAGRAIYYARGPLTYSPVRVLPAPLACESSVADFDDDGDADLNLAPGSVQCSNGQYEFASFAPRMPDAPAGSTYHGPGYTGDFDGDGDADWIVARADNGVFAQMERLVNLGDGTFVLGGAAGPSGVSFGLDAPLQHDARSFFTGDLDADGDLDLVTRSTQAVASQWKSRVWLNNGQGVFTPGQLHPYLCVMAIARLNSDAHVDLLVSSGLYSDPLFQVLAGAGDGTFTHFSTLYSNYFDSEGPTETVGVLDCDADGDLDVAAISQEYGGWGEMYLWRNNGNGAFTATWLTPTMWINTLAAQSAHVVAGDVNGDGWDDLVAWPAMEGNGGSWVVLRSSNGATFEAPILQGVQPLALVDIDSDGDADSIGRGAASFDNARVMSRVIDGPDVGARRQYGEGTGSPAGCVPLLGAVGPFRVGERMQLRMRGGVGGATGYLAVSMLESATPDTPFPGMTRYVGLPLRKLPIKLDGQTGVPCAGEKTRQFIIPPGYAGRTFFHQLVLNDASAPNGVVCSNGLEISYD